MDDYLAHPDRYQSMQYRRSGKSGLLLPALTLGLWHNFGETTPLDRQRALLRQAFDLGITHFDLANNYGPPYGGAETSFGQIFSLDFKPYRDELLISTKAGYDMWPGPYGNWGSKKYLVASLDQSLGRMGLDYVDIFYHHRPDLDTPLEETMAALDLIVRQGKALYIGLSNYHPHEMRAALAILHRLGTPCAIHQPSYSMLNRWIETEGLIDLVGETGVGIIAFSPLAQGLLTGKYQQSIPADSRIASNSRYLTADALTTEKLARIQKLNELAAARGQTLAQFALAWVLRDPRVTSALIGASRPEQIIENVAALKNLSFHADELATIEQILG
ncbi:MAG: L-glyceraldehyde 3-phosphate reductase [Eubacteriales bacterium]|nr:L-glyceraldehyde 3-phosphate reductase [Eubacteriales bacterium]